MGIKLDNNSIYLFGLDGLSLSDIQICKTSLLQIMHLSLLYYRCYFVYCGLNPNFFLDPTVSIRYLSYGFKAIGTFLLLHFSTTPTIKPISEH